MKRSCLITHAQATHSVEGKVGGWSDSGLTAKGMHQALELREKIANYNFELKRLAAYSSDLKRAVQAAEIILDNSGSALNLDCRLREMSFGRHEGMCQREHEEIIVPASLAGDRLDHKICAGAESRREVAIRVSEFVSGLMEIDGDALVVTHGFAATFFIAAFQNLNIESMGYLAFTFKPASISVLLEDDIFKNRSVSVLNV